MIFVVYFSQVNSVVLCWLAKIIDICKVMHTFQCRVKARRRKPIWLNKIMKIFNCKNYLIWSIWWIHVSFDKLILAPCRLLCRKCSPCDDHTRCTESVCRRKNYGHRYNGNRWNRCYLLLSIVPGCMLRILFHQCK